MRPPPSYRCSPCAWHTPEKPGWPNSLRTTQFLDRKALEQVWPNKISTFTSEMSKDGLRLAPITHRAKESTASGAGHSADTWNPSNKHVGSWDKGPGFLTSSVLAAPRTLPTPCSLKTPTPPRTWRKYSYGLLSTFPTKVLSFEIFTLCWKPVKWPP